MQMLYWQMLVISHICSIIPSWYIYILHYEILCVFVCVFRRSHSIWQCKNAHLQMTLYISWAKFKKKQNKNKTDTCPHSCFFHLLSPSPNTMHCWVVSLIRVHEPEKNNGLLLRRRKISLITLELFAHLPGNGSKYLSIKRNIGIFLLCFPS